MTVQCIPSCHRQAGERCSGKGKFVLSAFCLPESRWNCGFDFNLLICIFKSTEKSLFYLKNDEYIHAAIYFNPFNTVFKGIKKNMSIVITWHLSETSNFCIFSLTHFQNIDVSIYNLWYFPLSFFSHPVKSPICCPSEPPCCVQSDIQGLEITVPLAKWCNYTETFKNGLGFYVASNLEIDGKKAITAERSEDKATHV